MGFIQHNENPDGRNVGDCTIRAIAKALGQSWEETYVGVALQGLHDAGYAVGQPCVGAHLRSRGFDRDMTLQLLPGRCHTVADFAAEHPEGTYPGPSPAMWCACKTEIGSHLDSGGEIPLYYWHKEA